MGAADASGGVAGGAQHLADVSGQQRCLERLGGVSARDPLEQVRQVYGSVKAVGAGGTDPGAQIGVRAGTGAGCWRGAIPGALGAGADEVFDIVVACR